MDQDTVEKTCEGPEKRNDDKSLVTDTGTISMVTGGAALGLTIGAALGGPIGAVAGGVAGAGAGVATSAWSHSESHDRRDGKPAAKH